MYDENVLESEFGCIKPVKWATATFYQDEKLQICECGKPVTTVIMSIGSYEIYCTMCLCERE